MDTQFKTARLQRKAENIYIWERVLSAFSTVSITTQAEIAYTCGLGQGSVSRWANGVNYPSTRNMLDISRRTRHCVQWLYSGEGPRLIEGSATDIEEPVLVGKSEMKIYEIAALIRALPKSVRREVLAYIRFRTVQK